MNKLQRAVVLAKLASRLADKGSWCGETHMQKATYLLQALTGRELGYSFVIYKHGPFSFDLRDELTGLRADGLFKLVPQPAPYGPSLVQTDTAVRLQQVFKATVSRYQKAVEFVADVVRDMGVAELERLSTALFITVQKPTNSAVDRAIRLYTLKPHVSADEAREAINSVDKLRRDVESCLQTTGH